MIDAQDAPLPPDCRIHYRLTDAQGRTRRGNRADAVVGQGHGCAVGEPGAPLEFCFTGGDDRKMKWIEVQVIDPPEPPAVRSLTLKISPPSYTNWPDEQREATSTRPILAGFARAACGQGHQAAQADKQTAVR